MSQEHCNEDESNLQPVNEETTPRTFNGNIASSNSCSIKKCRPEPFIGNLTPTAPKPPTVPQRGQAPLSKSAFRSFNECGTVTPNWPFNNDTRLLSPCTPIGERQPQYFIDPPPATPDPQASNDPMDQVSFTNDSPRSPQFIILDDEVQPFRFTDDTPTFATPTSNNGVRRVSFNADKPHIFECSSVSENVQLWASTSTDSMLPIQNLNINSIPEEESESLVHENAFESEPPAAESAQCVANQSICSKSSNPENLSQTFQSNPEITYSQNNQYSSYKSSAGDTVRSPEKSAWVTNRTNNIKIESSGHALSGWDAIIPDPNQFYIPGWETMGNENNQPGPPGGETMGNENNQSGQPGWERIRNKNNQSGTPGWTSNRPDNNENNMFGSTGLSDWPSNIAEEKSMYPTIPQNTCSGSCATNKTYQRNRIPYKNIVQPLPVEPLSSQYDPNPSAWNTSRTLDDAMFHGLPTSTKIPDQIDLSFSDWSTSGESNDNYFHGLSTNTQIVNQTYQINDRQQENRSQQLPVCSIPLSSYKDHALSTTPKLTNQNNQINSWTTDERNNMYNLLARSNYGSNINGNQDDYIFQRPPINTEIGNQSNSRGHRQKEVIYHSRPVYADSFRLQDNNMQTNAKTSSRNDSNNMYNSIPQSTSGWSTIVQQGDDMSHRPPDPRKHKHQPIPVYSDVNSTWNTNRTQDSLPTSSKQSNRTYNNSSKNTWATIKPEVNNMFNLIPQSTHGCNTFTRQHGDILHRLPANTEATNQTYTRNPRQRKEGFQSLPVCYDPNIPACINDLGQQDDHIYYPLPINTKPSKRIGPNTIRNCACDYSMENQNDQITDPTWYTIKPEYNNIFNINPTQSLVRAQEGPQFAQEVSLINQNTLRPHFGPTPQYSQTDHIKIIEPGWATITSIDKRLVFPDAQYLCRTKSTRMEENHSTRCPAQCPVPCAINSISGNNKYKNLFTSLKPSSSYDKSQITSKYALSTLKSTYEKPQLPKSFKSCTSTSVSKTKLLSFLSKEISCDSNRRNKNVPTSQTKQYQQVFPIWETSTSNSKRLQKLFPNRDEPTSRTNNWDSSIAPSVPHPEQSTSKVPCPYLSSKQTCPYLSSKQTCPYLSKQTCPYLSSKQTCPHLEAKSNFKNSQLEKSTCNKIQTPKTQCKYVIENESTPKESNVKHVIEKESTTNCPEDCTVTTILQQVKIDVKPKCPQKFKVNVMPTVPEINTDGIITIPVQFQICQTESEKTTDIHSKPHISAPSEEKTPISKPPRERFLYESNRVWYEHYMKLLLNEFGDETDEFNLPKLKSDTKIQNKPWFESIQEGCFAESYLKEDYCATENMEVQTELALGNKLLSTSLNSITINDDVLTHRSNVSKKSDNLSEDGLIWENISLPPKGMLHITQTERRQMLPHIDDIVKFKEEEKTEEIKPTETLKAIQEKENNKKIKKKSCCKKQQPEEPYQLPPPPLPSMEPLAEGTRQYISLVFSDKCKQYENYTDQLNQDFPEEEISDSPCTSKTEIPWNSILLPINPKIRKIKMLIIEPLTSTQSEPLLNNETTVKEELEVKSCSNIPNETESIRPTIQKTELAIKGNRKCRCVKPNEMKSVLKSPTQIESPSKPIQFTIVNERKMPLINTKLYKTKINITPKLGLNQEPFYLKTKLTASSTCSTEKILTHLKCIKERKTTDETLSNTGWRLLTNGDTVDSPICKFETSNMLLENNELSSQVCCTSTSNALKKNEECEISNVITNSESCNKPFKDDPVLQAFKACEAELRPVKEALVEVQTKLRKLNLPELDCIFKQEDLVCDFTDYSQNRKNKRQFGRTCNWSNIPPTPELPPYNLSVPTTQFGYGMPPGQYHMRTDMERRQYDMRIPFDQYDMMMPPNIYGMRSPRESHDLYDTSRNKLPEYCYTNFTAESSCTMLPTGFSDIQNQPGSSGINSAQFHYENDYPDEFLDLPEMNCQFIETDYPAEFPEANCLSGSSSNSGPTSVGQGVYFSSNPQQIRNCFCEPSTFQTYPTNQADSNIQYFNGQPYQRSSGPSSVRNLNRNNMMITRTKIKFNRQLPLKRNKGTQKCGKRYSKNIRAIRKDNSRCNCDSELESDNIGSQSSCFCDANTSSDDLKTTESAPTE